MQAGGPAAGDRAGSSTGYATREDIDTAARAGPGLPMGSLAGLVLAGLNAMRDGYGDPACAPPPLLREHAAAAALAFCG
jgi:3-hydroxyacyl-CoA dehydrogenase